MNKCLPFFLVLSPLLLLLTPGDSAGFFKTRINPRQDGTSLSGGTMMGPLAWCVIDQAIDDTTPSIGTIGGCTSDTGGNILQTNASNTGATVVTDFDNELTGQILYIVGQGGTFPTTINDGGNFALNGNWIGTTDNVLEVFVQGSNDFVEVSRSTVSDVWFGSTINMGGNINLESAEIIDNSADGKIKLAGSGQTNNEALIIDLETVANEPSISSDSGVTELQIDGMDLSLDPGKALRFDVDGNSYIESNADNSLKMWAGGMGVVLVDRASSPSAYRITNVDSFFVDTPLSGQMNDQWSNPVNGQWRFTTVGYPTAEEDIIHSFNATNGYRMSSTTGISDLLMDNINIDLYGGEVLYDSAQAVNIGTAATSGNGLGTGDAICGGDMEVDGVFYADGGVVSSSATYNGDLIIDNTGTDVDSYILYLRGDSGGAELEGFIQLQGNASDPFLQVAVDDDIATPATVDVLEIHDTSLLFSADNTVDIGADGATRPKNVYTAGNVEVSGSIVLANDESISNAVDNQIKLAASGAEDLSFDLGTVANEVSLVTGSGLTDFDTGDLKLRIGNPTVDANYALHIATSVSGGGVRVTDTGGPSNYVFQRDSVTPADGDVIGQILFNHDDDGAAESEYARISAEVQTPGAAAEDGIMRLSVTENGSSTEYVRLDATNSIETVTISKSLDMSDLDISDVGDIALDSLSADGSIISITDDVAVDNTGTDVDSKILYLRGDSSSAEIEGFVQLQGNASDPFLQIAVDDDIGTPATTDVLEIHDTALLFSTDNVVDIGAAGANRAKDLHLAGDVYTGLNQSIYLDTDDDTLLVSEADDQISVYADTVLMSSVDSSSQAIIKTASNAIWIRNSADTGDANLYVDSLLGDSHVRAGTTNNIYWKNRTKLSVPTDGQIQITDNAEVDKIVLDSIAADATITSSTGTLVLGGQDNTNNELLKFDFETVANEVSLSSSTSVDTISTGTLDLDTGGELDVTGDTYLHGNVFKDYIIQQDCFDTWSQVGYANSYDITSLVTNGGTNTIVTNPSEVTLTTDNNANDTSGTRSNYLVANRARDYFFEIEMEIDSVTNSEFYTGYYKDANEFVQIVFDASVDTEWNLLVADDGAHATETVASTITVAADTEYILGIQVDASGNVAWWIDGVAQTAPSTNQMTADPHYYEFYVKTENGDVKVAEVDYIELQKTK